MQSISLVETWNNDCKNNHKHMSYTVCSGVSAILKIFLWIYLASETVKVPQNNFLVKSVINEDSRLTSRLAGFQTQTILVLHLTASIHLTVKR